MDKLKVSWCYYYKQKRHPNTKIKIGELYHIDTEIDSVRVCDDVRVESVLKNNTIVYSKVLMGNVLLNNSVLRMRVVRQVERRFM